LNGLLKRDLVAVNKKARQSQAGFLRIRTGTVYLKIPSYSGSRVSVSNRDDTEVPCQMFMIA